jgi:hypothetical protein
LGKRQVATHGHKIHFVADFDFGVGEMDDAISKAVRFPAFSSYENSSLNFKVCNFKFKIENYVDFVVAPSGAAFGILQTISNQAVCS